MPADSTTPRPWGAGFIDFLIHKPWRSMLLGLVVIMAAGAGGKNLFSDFTYRVWFNDDDPLLMEFDAFERRFGNDEAAIVVVRSPSGIFDIDSSLLVYELTERLWRVTDIIRVDSLANYNWVHAEDDDMIVEPILPEEALEPYLDGAVEDIPAEARAEIQAALDARKAVAVNHETLPNYLVSKDGTVTVLLAALKPALEGTPNHQPVVEEIRQIFKDFEGRSDHEFYQIGAPAVNLSFAEAAQEDLSTLLPIVFGLAVLLLAWFLRRVTGVLLPLLVTGLTVMAAMGLGGWLGFSINNMTSIVPQILLAIAVADSVHVLSVFYRSMARGAPRREAARHALQKNLTATLLTTVSTAIGFFSFTTADVVPIGMLGTLAGAGTVFAWIFTYFTLGPLLVLLPFKQRVPAAGGADLEAITPLSAKTTGWLQAWRKPIVVAALLLTAGMIALATQSSVNSNPYDYFQEDSELNRARVVLEASIGGALPTEIVIDAGEEEGIKDPDFMKRVDAFQAWLDTRDFVTSTVSLVDILKATNRSLNGEAPDQYVIPDTRRGIAEQYLLYTMSLPQGMDLKDRVTLNNDALRLSSSWQLYDSATTIAEIENLKRVAKAQFGLDTIVTGKTQLWQRMNPAVVDSFVTSISVALVLITLLLMIVFRSPLLGLLAMLPNTLPLLVGAAFLVAIGKTLDIGTVIVFSVCLGIAVDDTVHFLTHFNRHRRAGVPAHDAVAKVFSNTMPALVITTAILVIAFGAFAFASFIPNQFFGIMVAFVLSSALVADATVLPAILMWRSGPPTQAEPAPAPPADAIPQA